MGAHYCPGCGQRIHAGMIALFSGGQIPDDYRCSRCNSPVDDIIRMIVLESDQKAIREMTERGKKEVDDVIADKRYDSLLDVETHTEDIWGGTSTSPAAARTARIELEPSRIKWWQFWK